MKTDKFTLLAFAGLGGAALALGASALSAQGSNRNLGPMELYVDGQDGSGVWQTRGNLIRHCRTASTKNFVECTDWKQ